MNEHVHRLALKEALFRPMLSCYHLPDGKFPTEDEIQALIDDFKSAPSTSTSYPTPDAQELQKKLAKIGLPPQGDGVQSAFAQEELRTWIISRYLDPLRQPSDEELARYQV